MKSLLIASAAIVIGWLMQPAVAAPKRDCSLGSEVEFDLRTDADNPAQLRASAAGGAQEFNFESSGAKCGRDSKLLDTFTNTKLAVRVKNKRFEFVPLLLTDKRPFKCRAVKVHTACHGEPTETADGGFTIELRATPDPRSTKTLVTVGADGRPQYLVSNTQFVLMDYLDDGQPFNGKVDRALTGFRCTGSQPCDYQRNYFVEWQYLDRLRAVRQIRPPSEVEAKHYEEFSRQVASRITGVQKIVQTFILQNEIGTKSPYHLRDAVLADSGPSFGAHQIDIGTNKPADVAVFRDIVLSQYGQAADPQGRRLVGRVQRRIYQKPINEYPTTVLASLYADWLPINAALASERGRERYHRAYLKYLERSEQTFAELQEQYPYIRQYPWVGFHLIDIANQYGGNVQSAARFGKAAEQAKSKEEFLERVRGIMLSYRYAQRGYRASCDVKRRLKNVIVVVNSHPEGGGPWPVPADCNDEKRSRTALQ